MLRMLRLYRYVLTSSIVLEFREPQLRLIWIRPHHRFGTIQILVRFHSLHNLANESVHAVHLQPFRCVRAFQALSFCV